MKRRNFLYRLVAAVAATVLALLPRKRQLVSVVTVGRLEDGRIIVRRQIIAARAPSCEIGTSSWRTIHYILA